MPKKILVADDSITIQTVFRMTLSKEDYDLTIVGDGKEALEKAQQIHPDLIIADANMPEKTGYEICETIKRDPALKDIPVLILAGALEGIDEKTFIRVGGDGYLLKPFETKELFAKVRELLEKKEKGVIAVPREEVIEEEKFAEAALEKEIPVEKEAAAKEITPPEEEVWDFSDLVEEEELMEEIEDRTIDLSQLEAEEVAEEEMETIIEGEPIEEEIPDIEFEKEAISLEEEGEAIPEIAEELYIEEEIPKKEEPIKECIPEEKPSIPQELLEIKRKELVDRLSKEFFPQISELIVATIIERIEKIAWEVIPEIAEALVKEEIQRIRQAK